MTYNITHLPFCIGRDADNDLVVASRDLSRHHVALTRDISGRIRLTDLNSTNGSFVNRSASKDRVCSTRTTLCTSAPRNSGCG
jgi:hypothetical protein